MSKPLRNLWIWTTVFFSLFTALPQLGEEDQFPFLLVLVLSLVGYSFGLAVLYLLLRFLCPGMFPSRSQIREKPEPSRKQIRIFFWSLLALLVLAALPAFLALYPGTFAADAPLQLAMLDGTRVLTTHHPLIHTYTIGFFIWLGENVFHQANTGVALYIFFVQILFCSCALSFAMSYLYQKGMPAWMGIVMPLLVYASPLVQIVLCYSTKDIPFAASLLIFITYCCRRLFPVQSSNAQTGAHENEKLIFWGVLTCLLRNQGIYMILASLVLIPALFMYRLRKRRTVALLFSLGVILVISFLCNSVVPSIFSVAKGDKREMLSVPIHQIASAMNRSLDTPYPVLSDELMKEADDYFFEFDPDTFDPLSADNAKDRFITRKMNENPGKFLSLYARIVQADPLNALRAAVLLVRPYFDMTWSGYNPLAMSPSYEEITHAHGIHEDSRLPDYRQFLTDTIISTTSAKRCPFWLRLCDPALVLYLIAFMTGYALFYRKGLCRIVLVFPVLYILTMFLGPVALLRYSFVYVLEWPLLAGCLYLSHFRPVKNS